MNPSNTNAVLTIAGSDPSGGAGVQADLKTFAAHGCYGASILTALTAQNTKGVQNVFPVPPEFVEQQIISVLDDIGIRAIKTGMLYDKQIVRIVAQNLKDHYKNAEMPAIICDPVCVSTSGHALLQEDAVGALIEELFPISTLITPNKSEAELLLSKSSERRKIENLQDVVNAAKELVDLIARRSGDVPRENFPSVLLKGGHIVAWMSDIQRLEMDQPDIVVVRQHLPGENMEILLTNSPPSNEIQLVVDVLHVSGERKTNIFVRPRVDSKSTHGTGCTLSSAIASQLAKGCTLEKAVGNATMYTYLGIMAAAPIGHGHGPLNHLHNISAMAIPRPSTTNRYPFTRLLIESTAKMWKEYVEHDFVVLLGKGILDKKQFVHFVKQDYLYLKYYARASAFLAAKSTSFPAIAAAAQTMLNVLHEVGNHKDFCARFAGITEDELDSTPEASATTAYGAYLIDIAVQGGPGKLMMALIACLLGYGEVGLWLKKQSAMPNSWVVLQDNPYKSWMDEYAGDLYQNAVKIGLDAIENMALTDPPSEIRFAEWLGVWTRCTKLEKAFWDMAINLAE